MPRRGLARKADGTRVPGPQQKYLDRDQRAEWHLPGQGGGAVRCLPSAKRSGCLSEQARLHPRETAGPVKLQATHTAVRERPCDRYRRRGGAGAGRTQPLGHHRQRRLLLPALQRHNRLVRWRRSARPPPKLQGKVGWWAGELALEPQAHVAVAAARQLGQLTSSANARGFFLTESLQIEGAMKFNGRPLTVDAIRRFLGTPTARALVAASVDENL